MDRQTLSVGQKLQIKHQYILAGFGSRTKDLTMQHARLQPLFAGTWS